MDKEVSSQQAANNVLILEVDEAVEERIIAAVERILTGNEERYDLLRDKLLSAMDNAKQRKDAYIQQRMMQYQQAQRAAMQQTIYTTNTTNQQEKNKSWLSNIYKMCFW